MFKLISKLDYCISKLEIFIMATGIILMAANTSINVISRFLLNHSIVYAEELNSIFILLVTFAGIGYAARHGRHIRMSAFYEAAPFKTRKALMIVITAFTGFCMLFFAWFSVDYIIGLAMKGRVMPALGIPVYMTYTWVPIGFFITGIQYLLTCWMNLRNPEIYLSTSMKEKDQKDQSSLEV